MEQKEIIKGNILIAEFMGMERTEKETGEPTYKQGKNAVIWASQLMYHSSWDWLMPVWDKLGKEMYKIRRQISGEEYKKAEVLTIHILTAFREVDIKSAFLWIAEAIKWYNQPHP